MAPGPPPAAAPKVALLFLSRGQLPHAELWHRWLLDAAGQLPRHHAAAFGCSPAHAELLRQACGGAMDPPSISSVAVSDGGDEGGGAADRDLPPAYKRQQLFTLYIHSSASFDPRGAYPPGSVFENRTLACRITPEWGSHDLVEAQRLLYRAALEVRCGPRGCRRGEAAPRARAHAPPRRPCAPQDPLNQRFLLVSEADVPLYPASMLWAQVRTPATGALPRVPGTAHVRRPPLAAALLPAVQHLDAPQHASWRAECHMH